MYEQGFDILEEVGELKEEPARPPLGLWYTWYTLVHVRSLNRVCATRYQVYIMVLTLLIHVTAIGQVKCGCVDKVQHFLLPGIKILIIPDS